MKFDVVIPAAYAEQTLCRAATSVLSSPLVKKLFIVVDAGQETLACAEKLAQHDGRVQVLQSQNAGPGVARNLGLEQCSSEWVAFLDADDEYAPGYLEAISALVEADPQLALIHTRIVRIVDGQETDNHPLRFRFEQGNRTVHLAEAPHMIGHSVAAAAFNRALLCTTGVRFLDNSLWSEDANFILCYLLSLTVREKYFTVGLCADATYRYFIDTSSTTVNAWSNPAKYTEPFEKIYLPWVVIAESGLGYLPAWVQNSLLYELFWYIDADRQVKHPCRKISPEVLTQCSRYISQIARHLDYSVIENYALTPVSLDRRLLLLAQTRKAHHAPVNGQVIAYQQKPWQKLRKYTYFFFGDTPQEHFFSAGQATEPVYSRWVSHTLFGVEMIRERILWFSSVIELAELNKSEVQVAPFAGHPKLPGLQKPNGALSIRSTPQPRLLTRVRKALWHLRHRKKPEVSGQKTLQQIPARHTWFYMDRYHRAGDNAEVFYRYAAPRVPDVEHLFALSKESNDWARLKAEGFQLIDTASKGFQKAVLSADNILVSDISDTFLAPVLNSVSASQRIIFLQHGIIRNPLWRWLNSRRIDIMVTTTDDETDSILRDGSSYTLSQPEIWQTGMPRLDRLNELHAWEERRDVLLIAPTWEADLRSSNNTEKIQNWLNQWTGSWIPEKYLSENSKVKPVFFVHPNMENAINQLKSKQKINLVYGTELPQYLVRSVAVVTDRSSIADEARYLDIPVFLISANNDSLVAHTGPMPPGFIFVDSFSHVAQEVFPLLDDNPWRPKNDSDRSASYSANKALLSRLLE